MSQVQGGGVSTLRDREFPPCSFHCSLSPLFELQTGQKGLSFFRRQYSSKLRYTLHANARAAAGDLVARDGAPTHFGFNPRPRATGDDSRPVAPDVPERVSIHARAWRATSTVTSCSTSYSSFNPRPRAAGDRERPKFYSHKFLGRRFREPNQVEMPRWGSSRMHFP